MADYCFSAINRPCLAVGESPWCMLPSSAHVMHTPRNTAVGLREVTLPIVAPTDELMFYSTGYYNSDILLLIIQVITDTGLYHALVCVV
jgi:hypothetical protein